FALRGRERFEHVVGRVLTTRRTADADAGAQVVLGGERLRDGAQAVVATFAATLLELDRAEGQIEFVVHHDDLVDGYREELGQRGHRTTRQVHVRTRLGQQDLAAVQARLQQVGAGFLVLSETAADALG